MAPKAILGRGRNKVKYCKWGFYLKGDGSMAQQTMKLVREGASGQKARAGGGPRQALVVEKVSKTKVEIAWPLPVSADSCCLLLKRALGGSWRNFVTDPAGVQGAHQEAATAEEGEVEADPAGEKSSRTRWGQRCSTSLPPAAGRLVQPRVRFRRGPRVWERSSRALQQPRPAVVPICSQ